MARRLAKMAAILKKSVTTMDVITHHNMIPIERFSLLYNIHTPSSPQGDPCQSSQALSNTVPTNTGPGIVPVKHIMHM